MNNLAINVENASVYLDGTEILHNISWNVKKGEKYFILGANGAGKTTLVRTILGYLWPKYDEKTKIEVLNNVYGHTNLNTLRKSIAWVSPFLQSKLLKESTGISTVLSGPEGFLGFFRKATEEELENAKKLLKSLNASHLADKSILSMSSGEQMKILIARALMTKPELMILDEPTVYLDIAEREFFLNTINKLAQMCPDLTLIFISQRIEDILPPFKRGMILKKGNIEVIGSREEVLSESNLKKAFGIDIKLIKANNGRFWTVIE